MATKREPIRRNDVIRCEYCGEDYSVTYKRCPFCDGRPARASSSRSGGSGGERRSSGGGKRLATNKRGGGYGGRPDPAHIIAFALSIILIIAALYIVITVVSPLFTGGGGGDNSSDVSHSQSQGGVNSQTDPDGSDVTPPAVTGLTLNTSETSLNAGATYQLTATLTPDGTGATVTWASSDESVATVSDSGLVTNVNSGTSAATVTITATAGDVSATCQVQCSGSGTAAAGSTGVVTGTTTGLLIRSGPGREYEALATATNGATVTILEDTGTGWYHISYQTGGGNSATGYVSKDYITVR